MRFHADEIAIIDAAGAITVSNTDGFSTNLNEVLTVMSTSGGHAAFLIAYPHAYKQWTSLVYAQQSGTAAKVLEQFAASISAKCATIEWPDA